MIGLLPDLLLGSGLAVLLTASLFEERISERMLRQIAAAIAGAAALACLLPAPAGAYIFGTLRVDAISQLFKAVIAASLCGAVLLPSSRSVGASAHRAELMAILFASALGMALLVGAAEAITFTVALELASISLYAAVAMGKRPASPEAAVKYLIFGAAASGLFLYGFSILAALAGGSLNLETMGLALVAAGPSPAMLLGLLFVVIALFFKLSLAPFHFWAPDAYEASDTRVTAFIATASKAAAAAALVRLTLWLGMPDKLVTVLVVFSAVSMTWGNAAAIVQRDAKRLLAYSSVAQAGYMLVGIVGAHPDGVRAVLFYAAGYAVMNLAAFLVVACVDASTDNESPQLEDLDGLSERSPLLALLLLAALLSLAGIPPFVGFAGKWFLFSAAMKNGYGLLVLLGAVNSVISLYYYLMFIKRAYFHKPEDRAPVACTGVRRWLAIVLLIAIIALGVFPNPLLEASRITAEYICAL